MKAFGLALLVGSVVSAFAEPIPVAEVQRVEPVDFGREIYPVLKQNCLACHNTTKAKGNLNLESPELMKKGGDSGPAVVPGKSTESLLLKSAAHQDEDLLMPPPGNKSNAVALTSLQLGLLRLWIDQGANGSAVAETIVPPTWREPAVTGPMQAVAISPDGRLAAAARGNRLELCELSTGRMLAYLGDPELAKRDPWKGQTVADCDAVMSIAFASDELLATGGFRTVRLWRRLPRVVTRDFGVLPESPTRVTVSGDGKWAAAGDAKGGVWLWDLGVEKFEPIPLKEHTVPITALAFSPEADVLISTAEDKSTRVWSVSERKVVLAGNAPAVIHSLAFVDGIPELVAGCADGVARVWSWAKEPPSEIPSPVREFKLQDQPLYTLAMAQDGLFAWVSADGSLRFSKISNGEEQRKVTPERPLTRKVARLEHELRVAQSVAGTRKAQLEAYTEKLKKESETSRTAAQTLEKSRTELRRKAEAAESAVEALRLAPEDKALQAASKKAGEAVTQAETALRAAKANAELGIRMASEAAGAHKAAENLLAGADAAVVEAQTAVEEEKKRVGEPLPEARQLAISPNSRSVAIGRADGRVSHIALENGALLESPDYTGVLAATPAGELLAVAPDKHVRLTSARRVWALERVIGKIEDPSLLSDRVMTVAFSPDGKLLATGGGTPSRDGELKIWRVADGTLIQQITKAHADTVNAVAFSPDGELLASAASDRFARIWRVADGSRVANLEGHTGHVLSVTWRADGLALATAGADRTLRLWDLASRKQVKSINNFSAEIAAISYVGAGDVLLAASGDKTVRLGDKPLPNAESAFPFCATSDVAGQFVAAGGHDGILRVWDVAERKLIRTFTP